ncbi:spore cortex biosynthesis protein YabQ [Jeotgalibacillus aurantiacus]|uniref:spore cortex biosynthesis protein YabQ n=1 Tax=Jeotgalibacillus aurantiacus TaxID=2763266 RepID=UPI001D0B3611|nr:spore cortex biosynthesis protein YabQ [Jeotgalibacillus aurantiacus]
MIVEEQLRTVAYLAGSGFVIGLFLTLYHRYIIRSKRLPVHFVTDVIFWCCQALLVFLVMYFLNGVSLRLYMVLSVIFGFLIYRKAVQGTAIRLLVLIEKTVRLTWRILFAPVRWLWFLLKMICRFLLAVILLLLTPFQPFFQFSRKKSTFFAKKIKLWLNLLYNRE